MARVERLPLALQLLFLGKHLGYLLERRLASRGLNRTQSVVLMVLARMPGLKALDLSRPANVEPANVTRTLQSLERLGLLERRPHPTDGRASIFYLTPSGMKLAEEQFEELRELSDDLVSGMDGEELANAERTLSSLWRAVSRQLSAGGQPSAVSHQQEVDGAGWMGGVSPGLGTED